MARICHCSFLGDCAASLPTALEVTRCCATNQPLTTEKIFPDVRFHLNNPGEKQQPGQLAAPTDHETKMSIDSFPVSSRYVLNRTTLAREIVRIRSLPRTKRPLGPIQLLVRYSCEGHIFGFIVTMPPGWFDIMTNSGESFLMSKFSAVSRTH